MESAAAYSIKIMDLPSALHVNNTNNAIPFCPCCPHRSCSSCSRGFIRKLKSLNPKDADFIFNTNDYLGDDHPDHLTIHTAPKICRSCQKEFLYPFSPYKFQYFWHSWCTIPQHAQTWDVSFLLFFHPGTKTLLPNI